MKKFIQKVFLFISILGGVHYCFNGCSFYHKKAKMVNQQSHLSDVDQLIKDADIYHGKPISLSGIVLASNSGFYPFANVKQYILQSSSGAVIRVFVPIMESLPLEGRMVFVEGKFYQHPMSIIPGYEVSLIEKYRMVEEMAFDPPMVEHEGNEVVEKIVSAPNRNGNPDFASSAVKVEELADFEYD